MKSQNRFEFMQLKAERHDEDGFTLIELLIVMSVMLIIMTLAIPQMLKLKKQANHLSAVQSMRAIGQAELQYNSAYPANGFSCWSPSCSWQLRSTGSARRETSKATPSRRRPRTRSRRHSRE